MAITTIDHQGNVNVHYAGRVVEVRTYHATRNCSDTLDYSDYDTVEVTEALVYVGRAGSRYAYRRLSILEGSPADPSDEVRELSVEERFTWVDCSNLFVWRGSDRRVPEVDAEALQDPNVAADHAAWVAWHAEQARAAAEKRAAWEKQEAERKLAEERNRPVKGKQMKVVRGRKVPVGTEGTVAYERGGRVLLKPDASWQDRNAQGVWVSAEYLQAR